MMDFWYANQVFKLAEERQMNYVSVEDDEISKLGQYIDKLNRKIRHNYREDDFLQSLLLIIRNYFYTFTSSLIPYNEINSIDLEDLRFRYRELRATFPNLYGDFLRVAQLFKTLLERIDNPLMEEVINLIHQCNNYKIGIVTRRSLKGEELIKFLSKINMGSNRIQVLNERIYKKSQVIFDYILFIGNENYFKSYVNNLPKAKRTTFIAYSIFRNYFKDRGLFSEISNSFSSLYKGVVNSLKKISSFEEEITFEEEKIDSKIIQQHLSQYDEEDNSHSNEPVDAKVVTLESDHIVLLQKGPKYKIIDPTSTNNKKIVNKVVSEMEMDDYLLIFTERESSIIAQIADELVFKLKAETYRNIQRSWKDRLNTLINTYGLGVTSKRLFKAGLKSAKPYNLKNWLKESTILPRDFYILLSALDYSSEEISEIITISHKIHAGHIRAGNIISRRAEEVIKNTDLTQLISNGTQTFEIPEFPGATFLVDRIVGIGKDTIKVHPSRIMQLYELNEFR